MDHLPMGLQGEMYEFIEHKRSAICYFLLRGVLESAEVVNDLILTEKGRYLLEHRYDRIFVMCDRRVADVVQEHGLTPAMASKLTYAGYVSEPVSTEARLRARAERGIKPTDKWVVCSGGGGHIAEELIRESCKLASQYTDVYFDIVLGPRSALPLPELNLPQRRVRVVKEDPLLPVLHAACDIVICPGGYNSLMESAVGNASIIVVPIHNDWEQREHATRLAKFLPVTLVEDLSQLSTTLDQVLECPPAIARTQDLELSGVEHLKRAILEDLKEGADSVALIDEHSANRRSVAITGVETDVGRKGPARP
jgi:predicted glycosyltransferase